MYKNIYNGRVISSSEYFDLDSYDRNSYSLVSESSSNDGDLLTSAAIGYATDSTLLGGLLGGSLLGGLLGDMLND